MLSLLAYVGLALVFLVVAAATFLFIAPPVDITRERVTAEFRTRTGYVLELNGMTSLSLLPTPSIEFRDVVIATAEEGGAPVLRAESVEIEPMLGPLLWGRVQPERIRIKRPQLDLIVGEDGRRRWLKAAREDGGNVRIRRLAQVIRERPADSASAPELHDEDEKPAEGRTGGRKSKRAIPSSGGDLAIHISDGIVRYRDLRSGSLTQADRIQLRLSRRQERKDEPLRARGSLAFNGENVRIDFGVDPSGVRGPKLEKVSLRLSGRHGEARYNGDVSLADQVSLSGVLEGKTRGLQEAAQWLGFRMRDSAGLTGAVALKGRLDVLGDRVRLEEMQLKADGIDASGQVELSLVRPRPRFAADLTFAELDLDRLRAERDEARSRRGEERARSRSVRRVERAQVSPEAAARPEASAPAEAALRDERGARGWRTEPIAFANLGGADGEARLRAARVVWRGAVLTEAAGGLSLADGAMRLDIREGALHGGKVRGVITASTAGHIGMDLALDGVSTLEVLGNTARFEVLEGPARIKLAVAGQGATEQEIVSTLTGTASLDIAGGALLGWSVDGIFSSVRRLELPNLDRNPSARTPFSRLSANLIIKDGIATAKDMRIAATPVSLDSTGTINLPARTLDLTLNPRLADGVATGAASSLAGLSVPLQLQGSWQRPRLSADYQRILRSSQKALDGVRDAARGIKDEDIDKAAKRLLGDTPEAQKGAKRAKDLLKRFLDR